MSAVATVDSAYAFTAASYAIILTRTLLRRLKHEKYIPDDYLMFFSMLFAALSTACYPISVNTSLAAMPGLGLKTHKLTEEKIYYGTILTVHGDPKTLTPEQIQHGSLYSESCRQTIDSDTPHS
jgi:hypothetical protein